jgi:hypothetical protein
MLAASCALLAAASASAGLDVRVVDASGAAIVAVPAGAPVEFRVEAELAGDAGLGLALLTLDLELPGGAIGPLVVPAGSPMAAFERPAGYSPNPAAYGGLPVGQRLLQAGGAQNVFAHGAWACDDDRDCPDGGTCGGGFCSPVSGLPTDPLVLGVALPGSPAVAGEAVATAPMQPGTYQLAVLGARATIVDDGATGDPVWRTREVATITSQPLEIVVTEGGGDVPAIPTAGPVGLALLISLLAGAGALLLRRRCG